MDLKTYKSPDPVAWCPGCGNFGILTAMKKALAGLELAPERVLLVSGIGQAAKLPHYLRCNCFNGLHGRALPVAAGARLANRDLTVVVSTGDGDCYGEGGNHLLHAIRRNMDLTVVVHDNQVYGLTKGQASPTSGRGFSSKVQPGGAQLAPLNPLTLAVSLGCGFVARGISNRTDHLADLIMQGVRHRGFSLIDVLQPCVSFNHINTYDWYGERVYDLADETEHDPTDPEIGRARSREFGERIPLGVIVRHEGPAYEDLTGLKDRTPAAARDIGDIDMQPAFQAFR